MALILEEVLWIWGGRKVKILRLYIHECSADAFFLLLFFAEDRDDKRVRTNRLESLERLDFTSSQSNFSFFFFKIILQFC